MAQSQFYMKYLNKILKYLLEKSTNDSYSNRPDVMDYLLFDYSNEEENILYNKLINKLKEDKYAVVKDESNDNVKITGLGVKFISEAKGYTLRDKIYL
jgi:hypothetical protein